MNSQRLVLGILITLSITGTLYSLFLVHISYGTRTVLLVGFSRVMFSYPYPIIPVFTSALGWLTVGYELFYNKQKDIRRVLRQEISGNKDGWEVYDVFKGRGGARRLSILEILSTPKVRNEIAKITGSDWKEVDRNLKVLESVDLVLNEPLHNSIHIYRLTEKGSEMLKVIQARIK